MIFHLLESGKHRRHHLLLLVVTFLGALYFLFNYQNYSKYTGNRPFTMPGTCRNLSVESMSHLLYLTQKVHQILEENEIEHWLCYGSVFGALRQKGPLPWDDDVDIGIRGDGKLSQMDLSTFLNLFESAGLKATNWWRRSRLIQISNGHPHLKVDLMAFYKCGKWMKRSGWETWIGYFNYDRYHTFPATLVKPPLPKMPFGNFDMPVPQDGIEIQKYLYPSDWWKVVKPAQC